VPSSCHSSVLLYREQKVSEDEQQEADIKLHNDLCAQGYLFPRKLPNGEWLALQRMLFTTGIFIVVNEDSWRTRWCYETYEEAFVAFVHFDGVGDPSGPWIKQKPEERLGPGVLGG
jgi:hypothetical protein